MWESIINPSIHPPIYWFISFCNIAVVEELESCVRKFIEENVSKLLPYPFYPIPILHSKHLFLQILCMLSVSFISGFLLLIFLWRNEQLMHNPLYSILNAKFHTVAISTLTFHLIINPVTPYQFLEIFLTYFTVVYYFILQMY